MFGLNSLFEGDQWVVASQREVNSYENWNNCQWLVAMPLDS